MKHEYMKNKILNLIKSAVWFVLCLFVGALIFEGIRSLTNSDKPAKKIGVSVFTEEGHDYLVVDTKHGVCVIHAESCPCRKNKQCMKKKELNVKLRVNMLILEIESALNISDSKFINAEHVLSQLRIIKEELEQ